MDYKEIFGEELGTQVESVVAEKKINLIVDDKENPAYIPKSRFNEVIGSKNELKSQVSELTDQLESLKKSAKGNDELIGNIEQLKQQNQELITKHSRGMLESAIKMKAIQEKANDINDIGKFLDYEALELDAEGNVKGLDEQFKAIKENKPYLFETVEKVKNNQPLNPNVSPQPVKESLKDKYDELQRQLYDNPNNKATMHQLFALKRKMQQL